MTVAQARVTTLDAIDTFAFLAVKEDVLRTVSKEIKNFLFEYKFGMLQELPKSSCLVCQWKRKRHGSYALITMLLTSSW